MTGSAKQSMEQQRKLDCFAAIAMTKVGVFALDALNSSIKP